MNQEVPTRRGAIKTVALFTATCLFPNQWSARVVAQVATPRTGELGFVRINLSDFPPLLSVRGSVRIGTSRILGFNPVGIFYPIIVTRASETQFYALDAQCTHASCVVPRFNASASYMECPCHGSRFAIDGEVLRGPAGFPLRQFNTSFDGKNSLKIEVPDIGFTLETQSVQNSGQNRLKLDFLGFQQLTYVVRFRPHITAEWVDVPFSLAADGPLDQTSFPGADDYASIYVDAKGASGFYAVFMQVRQV